MRLKNLRIMTICDILQIAETSRRKGLEYRLILFGSTKIKSFVVNVDDILNLIEIPPLVRLTDLRTREKNSWQQVPRQS